MNKLSLREIDELLQRLLDNRIDPVGMEKLQQAVQEDPQVRDYYVDSMLACAVLRRSSQATGEFTASDLIRALTRSGNQGRGKRVVRYLTSVAAFLILGLSIYLLIDVWQHKPQGPVIGVLAGTYETQWHGARPRPGEDLYAHPYDLRQGVAEMELGLGTRVLLEAPCRIELASADEIILTSGRLTVWVAPQTEGFRVQTQTALITDLGTEFGVIAHADGSTEAHVLQGRIRVALDPNRVGRSMTQVVKEGRATVVEKTGLTIRSDLMAQPDNFLRQLPSPNLSSNLSKKVNLAALVGGAKGRGKGAMDRGIDLGSGLAFRNPATEIQWTENNVFRSSPQFRGIDGVFVPNGATGPVVISSTGLHFAQCPETVGSYFGGPANSGKFFDLVSKQIFAVRLNGVPYGTPNHPALSLHPNAGITFDLGQIRWDNPEVQIDRFTARCGVSKDLPHSRYSPADIWILQDGVLSQYLRFPVELSCVKELDISISSKTRFLTLVASCSGLADYSWIIFGDPFLGPASTASPQEVP